MSTKTTDSPRVPASSRIASLDQFRGYTMLGMFVVNFVGYFTVIPAIFKHHNTYCSFADTIMPQFFFAVGFAYRLTFLRRSATGSRFPVCAHFVKRSLGLILIGAVLYVGGAALDNWLEPPPAPSAPFLVRALRTELFQALVHIGVTCLWIMPVIGATATIRIAFAVLSCAIHLILSRWFYYNWVMTAPPSLSARLEYRMRHSAWRPMTRPTMPMATNRTMPSARRRRWPWSRLARRWAIVGLTGMVATAGILFSGAMGRAWPHELD